MKKHIFILLTLIILFAIMLCGCGENPQTGDEFILTSEISSEKQALADEVLNKFMLCYEEDKPDEVLPLLSRNFGATAEEMEMFFDGIRKNCENPFVPYVSYYMNNLPASDGSVQVKNAIEDKNYIELVPANSELYCAIYKAQGEKVTYVLSFLLTEEDGGFKIAWINPGDFEYDGNNAEKLFELATTLENEGKIIPAYIYSCMLGNTLRPGGYFRDEKDTEMEDLCYRLFAEISEKYALPLTLSGTENSAVYQIGIANNSDYGIIPQLLIKTDVSISDREKLTQEAEKAVSSVGKLSGDLSESFGAVELHLTNDELADDTTSVEYETIVIDLK